jgi:hypothetical protein
MKVTVIFTYWSWIEERKWDEIGLGRGVGRESGEHRVIRTKYEDHQRRSKTNICNRMT